MYCVLRTVPLFPRKWKIKQSKTTFGDLRYYITGLVINKKKRLNSQKIAKVLCLKEYHDGKSFNRKK